MLIDAFFYLLEHLPCNTKRTLLFVSTLVTNFIRCVWIYFFPFSVAVLIIESKVFICYTFLGMCTKSHLKRVIRAPFVCSAHPPHSIFHRLLHFEFVSLDFCEFVSVWQSLCAPDLLINFLISGSPHAAVVVVVVWFSLFISDFTIQINFQCAQAKYMHRVYKFIKGKKKLTALVGTLYAYSGPHFKCHTGRAGDSRWKFM